MRITSAKHVHPRRLRRTVTALAVAVGVGVVMMAAPTAANAIPVGGWCYNDWYDVSSVGSVTQQPVIPTQSIDNSSSSTTVSWGESQMDSTTYTSSYSTTTSFSAGVDIWIIKAGVNSSQTRTTSTSITMSTTSSFTAPVPPHSWAYADYGPYSLQTSGTYNEQRYGCDNHDYSTLKSGALTAYSLTSVGWHYWDTVGSTRDY